MSSSAQSIAEKKKKFKKKTLAMYRLGDSVVEKRGVHIQKKSRPVKGIRSETAAVAVVVEGC